MPPKKSLEHLVSSKKSFYDLQVQLEAARADLLKNYEEIFTSGVLAEFRIRVELAKSASDGAIITIPTSAGDTKYQFSMGDETIAKLEPLKKQPRAPAKFVDLLSQTLGLVAIKGYGRSNTYSFVTKQNASTTQESLSSAVDHSSKPDKRKGPRDLTDYTTAPFYNLIRDKDLPLQLIGYSAKKESIFASYSQDGVLPQNILISYEGSHIRIAHNKKEEIPSEIVKKVEESLGLVSRKIRKNSNTLEFITKKERDQPEKNVSDQPLHRNTKKRGGPRDLVQVSEAPKSAQSLISTVGRLNFTILEYSAKHESVYAQDDSSRTYVLTQKNAKLVAYRADASTIDDIIKKEIENALQLKGRALRQNSTKVIFEASSERKNDYRVRKIKTKNPFAKLFVDQLVKYEGILFEKTKEENPPYFFSTVEKGVELKWMLSSTEGKASPPRITIVNTESDIAITDKLRAYIDENVKGVSYDPKRRFDSWIITADIKYNYDENIMPVVRKPKERRIIGVTSLPLLEALISVPEIFKTKRDNKKDRTIVSMKLPTGVYQFGVRETQLGYQLVVTDKNSIKIEESVIDRMNAGFAKISAERVDPTNKGFWFKPEFVPQYRKQFESLPKGANRYRS